MQSSHDNNYSYASNLEDFIVKNANQIDIWCHGHHHRAMDYEVAGVRIISNPRGYPTRINSDGFREDKLLCL